MNTDINFRKGMYFSILEEIKCPLSRHMQMSQCTKQLKGSKMANASVAITKKRVEQHVPNFGSDI